jgi:hypothetical protein
MTPVVSENKLSIEVKSPAGSNFKKLQPGIQAANRHCVINLSSSMVHRESGSLPAGRGKTIPIRLPRSPAQGGIARNDVLVIRIASSRWNNRDRNDRYNLFKIFWSNQSA